MALFDFCRGLFAWMATIVLFLPLSIPMAAFAYKVRNGPKPLDIEQDELWKRAIYAGLVFAAVTLGFVWLDWFIADGFNFPPGIVHLVIVMGYIPIGMWIMTFFFGFSDLLDGLSTFTIYMMLPLIVLWTANWAFGLWNWALGLVDPWLKPVEAY